MIDCILTRREKQESSEDNLTNLMGVAQALISIFAEEDDKIRCITRGPHKIAFVLKAPLYLFCVSDWGEPEHVVSDFRRAAKQR